MAESWDVLVSLKKILSQRQELLRKLEARIEAKVADLADQREQALVKVRKSLEREHRDYIKADPLRGQSYVEIPAQDRLSHLDPTRRASVGDRLSQMPHHCRNTYLRAIDGRSPRGHQGLLHGVRRLGQGRGQALHCTGLPAVCLPAVPR